MLLRQLFENHSFQLTSIFFILNFFKKLFFRVNYIIHISSTDNSLLVEVEEEATGERWCGKFSKDGENQTFFFICFFLSSFEGQ